jgi:hypothetical protein
MGGTMIAKITSVSRSKGKLLPAWAFEYSTCNADGLTLIGSLTVDEADRFAGCNEVGAIFEMCRVIQRTPATEYTWLLGRIFKRMPFSAGVQDHICSRQPLLDDCIGQEITPTRDRDVAT